MFTGLDWLNDIIQAILSLCPRPLVVRNTHSMLKWKWGRVAVVGPGWRWYWPLTTDYELVVTATQAMDMPPQTLLTKDGVEVTCGGIVISRVSDPIRAHGEKNYDVNGMIDAIAQAAVVTEIMRWTLDELVNDMDGVESALTAMCRSKLKRYGVSVQRTALNSFSTASTYNVMGINATQPE